MNEHVPNASVNSNTHIHAHTLTRRAREKKNQTHIEPLCIVTFVCFHHENTQSGKLMNSTCACATLAQKMEALKEKHRYFMQFSLKDDCILFFRQLPFVRLLALLQYGGCAVIIVFVFSLRSFCVHRYLSSVYRRAVCSFKSTQTTIRLEREKCGAVTLRDILLCTPFVR